MIRQRVNYDTWVAAGALAVLIGFRGILPWISEDALLASLLPDDAYYYLGIAAQWSQGHASTFDGLSSTNGYQPLWMVICVGVVQLLGSVDTMAERLHLVRVVVTLQLLLGVTAIWILANALHRSLQATSAHAFLLALACSPWVIYAVTNGVESGMTLLMFALLLFGFLAWDPLGSPARRTDGVLGLLLAGLIFSRLDLAFLVPIWAGLAFWRGKSMGFRWWIQKCTAWFGPIAILGGVYLLINHLWFGSALPISMRLKSTFPFPEWHPEWILRFPVEHLVILGSLFWLWIHRRSSLSGLCSFVILGTGYMLLQMLNGLFFVDSSIHRWHYTVHWGVAMVVGPMLIHSLAATVLRRSTIVIILAIVAAGAAGQWVFLHGRDSVCFQARAFEAAAWTEQHLGSEAVMAMSDCGAFGYFRGGRVINLDGLVNDIRYQVSLEHRRLGDYLSDHNVDYLLRHFVLSDTALPGYGALDYAVTSRLFDRHAAPVSIERLLREENEVYRSEMYSHPIGPGYLMIWEVGPVLAQMRDPDHRIPAMSVSVVLRSDLGAR